MSACAPTILVVDDYADAADTLAEVLILYGYAARAIHTVDDALGNIVERGYYNSTFQTRDYTMREWTKHMKMVDYVVAGMHNYQDLAVMRK